ncbi:aminodeoxychorismate synthase [Polytolypa hystricis UAMH7299]|uniref:aminodeoxychorismate synthase n=1 Tax=Polytolypa hystricis (strain UAMH7299) TaxID=1447883 RepID=A0A2B7X4W5_POLH7|nr:aminodeoxychorismate synthase [Polytolypa hystricis UAMH7299]
MVQAPGSRRSPATPPGKRILYLDAYDSFSRNIIDMLETNLDVTVTELRIDEHLSQPFEEYVRQFDAVVAGPGPGTPLKPGDVGFMTSLWELDNIPVLGICLGFQSLCHYFGAAIEKLPEPRHGRVNSFTHSGTDMFAGLASFNVTSYHSLQPTLGHVVETAPDMPNHPLRWDPSAQCVDLEPLAWFQGDEFPDQANLMAVAHRTKPFRGVQFHPESCKSDLACVQLIKNWWISVETYNTAFRPVIPRVSLPSSSSPLSSRPDAEDASNLPDPISRMLQWCESSGGKLHYRSLENGSLTAERICELVDVPSSQSVVLESNSRYCIISVLSPGAWTLEYRASANQVVIVRPEGKEDRAILGLSPEMFWDAVRMVMSKKRVPDGNPAVPFWGGFMGFISYEMGLLELGIEDDGDDGSMDGEKTADACLLWVERSIVMDRVTGKIYIQSIREGDSDLGEWLDLTLKRLDKFLWSNSTDHEAPAHISSNSQPQLNNCYAPKPLSRSDDILANLMVQGSQLIKPDELSYKSKIAACQKHIRNGDSYELCLTAQTKILLPTCKTELGKTTRPWILYKNLRKYNPASFSAYAKLGNAKVISSSPELFLQWDREANFDMRPMKGTVKKGPGMTLEKAKEILDTPKEMGENLMIADLVRHDLGVVCGSGGVEVAKLLEVEEHARVYQLITRVKGTPQFPSSSSSESTTNGNNESPTQKPRFPHDYNALSKCLPPGSMTGAPKKRSCELLKSIERGNRSVYSGVMGYLDVGGAGSFSVLIRTAFSWSDGGSSSSSGGGSGEQEIWRIGAGGAVTALSTAQGEWEEMNTKLETVLDIFRPKEGNGNA